jgi:chromosome segregation ATPase
MVDLERRLEGSARAEAQARRRAAELERSLADRSGGERATGERLAAAERELASLREEIAELRSENDFMSGEVARYHAKNLDLAARLQGK